MAQSLTQSVINRIVVNQPADYKDESYSGNLDVSSINSMLIHCRKENVRVFARITATQVWNVLGVVGDALDSVSGMGTEYRRDATFDVALMDRVSITSLGAETKARVIFNPTLPASLLTSAGGGASVTEHAMTTLVTGEAQTVAVGAGDAFVQVFDEVLPSDGSSVLSYTGADQSFVVPAGVTSITAKLWGAGAGAGAADNGPGGAGGFTTGTITVTPGETLTILTGEGGKINNRGAGGGGGRSAIRRTSTELLTAGAGGSATRGSLGPPHGGPGGGLSGSDGIGGYAKGGGGTQTAGGTSPAAGREGSQFQGGTVTTGGYASGTAYPDGGSGNGDNATWTAGGGGGGYFGGGAGSTGAAGGGSSYLGSATNASTESGALTIPPQQSDTDYVAGIGVGATYSAGGGNGLIVLSYASGAGATLEATTSHTIAHDSTAGTVTITPASNVANAKLRIVK